jgi:two-component sensor histidine kinase
VVEPCATVIPSRAVAILALVLNEMVSNAIKHGMAGQSEGTVTIRGSEHDGMVSIQVIDTGSGPPFKLPIEESGEGGNFEGLGLSLIKQLVGDLNGQFSLRREVPALLEQTSGTNNGNSGNGSQKGAAPAGHTVAEVRFPLKRNTRA